MSDADQPAPPIDQASRSTDPARRSSPNEKRPAAEPFFRRILGSLGRSPAPRPSASVRDARRLLFATLIYLPVLFAAMAADKIPVSPW